MIRPARPEDQVAIERIVHSVYLDRIGKEPGPMRENYWNRIAEGAVSVLEAEESGKIVALIVLLPATDYLLLDNVAVDPLMQHRGIGRQLIEFAEAEGRRLGFAELRLYTHEKMSENIALYRRLGFIETGRGRQDGYDRVFMRKAIAPGIA